MSRGTEAEEGDGHGRATLVLELVGLAALLLIGFRVVLFSGGQFAFRDAAHYYYPLYEQVRDQWATGRMPLWEPGVNGGASLIGNPTAAVLYPGKIIFALVPYAWGMRLYVVGHVALACLAMRSLVRSWGVSQTGAALAGLGYAFGGPVLSDTCNVIYLVGAAWAPLGFRAVDRWLRLGRRSALAELALVLALQVLGGDPQAAYVVVLCALGYAVRLAFPRPGVRRLGISAVVVGMAWPWVGPPLASWLRARGGIGQGIVSAVWGAGLLAFVITRRREARARVATGLVGLAGGCALATALAAAQLLPVIEQLASSPRWQESGASSAFEFSLLPYRVAEWVWPNVFGSFAPDNREWASLLPGAEADRPWTLSLYFGALPLVLALGAVGFRDGPPWRGWLSAVALFSFAAGLGGYAGTSGGALPSSSVESVYGLIATILPGFRLFRYPGKLLVFTSLALAALAGAGWDRAVAGVGPTRRRVWIGATVLLVLSTLGLAVGTSSVGRERFLAALAAAPGSGNSVFGPLDARGAASDLLWALGHGALAFGSALMVVAWSARRPGRAGLAALCLITADLAWANSGLVLTIPQRDFERMPEVVRAIRDAERANPSVSPGPFRVHRLPPWAPPGWSETSSPTRLRTLVDWEMDTVQPGFGLLHGLSYLLSDESDTGRSDFRRLFQPARRPVDPETAARLGVEPGQPVLFHPRPMFDLWGVRYFVLPSYPGRWSAENRSYAAFLDRTEMILPDPSRVARPEDRARWLNTWDVQVRRNTAAFPRAWVVHDARIYPPPDRNPARPGRSLSDAVRARLRAGGDAEGPAGLRAFAYIEVGDPGPLAPYLPGTTPDPDEAVDVRQDGPGRVILDAHLRRPGLVVLAETYDKGWRLTIDDRPAPVLKVNLLMRGAAVPLGSHRLVYTYDPGSVRVGLSVTLAGLVALAALGLWARFRPVVGGLAVGG